MWRRQMESRCRSLEQELADPSVSVLRGKMQRGGSGGEGLRGWHGAVVQEELSDLVVPVSAGVVESGTSDIIDLVDVTEKGKESRRESVFRVAWKKERVGGGGSTPLSQASRPKPGN